MATANRAAGIYPEPGQRRAAEEAKILYLEPYHIPWIRIALLGLGATILASLAYLVLTFSLFTLASATTSFIGTAGRIFMPISLLLAFGIYTLLNKWDVRYPAAIAWLATGLGLALYLILSKRADLILGSDAVATGPGFALVLLAGPVLLLGLTLVTNRLPRPPVTIGTLAITTSALVIFGFVLDVPKPVVTTVSQTAWAIKPAYLPAGVVEHANETCDSRTVLDAAYECIYYFDAFPGYLTQDTQTKIEKQLAIHRPSSFAPYEQPTPFFRVNVARDDRLLKPYQFTNGRCDITSMREVANTAAEYRKSDAYTHKPQALICVQTTTPGGKTVYYRSPKNDSETDVQAPTSFYFKQAGNVVMIRVGIGSVPQSFTSALYLTDPSFQQEIYKFIDSFE